MNKKDKINDIVDRTLNSANDIKRADAKPFLLNRINARLSQSKETIWEKASRFVARPSVAFAGLAVLILINLTVIIFYRSESGNLALEQSLHENFDEFTYTAVSIL